MLRTAIAPAELAGDVLRWSGVLATWVTVERFPRRRTRVAVAAVTLLTTAAIQHVFLLYEVCQSGSSS